MLGSNPVLVPWACPRFMGKYQKKILSLLLSLIFHGILICDKFSFTEVMFDVRKFVLDG